MISVVFFFGAALPVLSTAAQQPPPPDLSELTETQKQTGLRRQSEFSSSECASPSSNFISEESVARLLLTDQS